MARVQLEGITKRFGEITVVRAVDLDIADGEFVVLVGPSGCGKSTLLRMIAGLEPISGGRLLIDGQRADQLPPQKRNIAMVFQSYALYPHMTARQNIGYGPKLRGEPGAEVARKVEGAAGILNLFDYLDRLPRELSGGQRQRVAMGRALVRKPAVFLFDEPLSNLDAKLRVQMRTEIKALHRRLGTTIVYVTHDQIEAMTLADRIVVMNAGVVEQQGAPLDLYDNPANTFVAGFLGSPTMSFVEGVYHETAKGPRVRAGDADLPAPSRTGASPGQPVIYGIRPEHFEFADEDGAPVEVDLVEPTGADTHLYGTLGGARIAAVFHDRRPLAPGEIVRLRPLVEQAHLFDAASGRRLAASP